MLLKRRAENDERYDRKGSSCPNVGCRLVKQFTDIHTYDDYK